MSKPRVGFYGITGCAGCLLSVIFNEDEILDIASAVDIVAFPLIKDDNDNVGKLDIVFIEGTVVTNDDKAMVEQLRKRADVVVALGACAHLGNIPSIRHVTDERRLETLKYYKREQNDDVEGGPHPVHKVIKVDYTLPGCPPDREEIKTFLKEVLVGKTFYSYKDPVCVECKLKDNGCLLDEGEICLGPLIAGGCHAICPTQGFRCFGCRGFTDDANFEEYFELMEEKGHNLKDVKKQLHTFMATDVEEKLKGTKYENI